MKHDKGVTCIFHIHRALYAHTYIAIMSTSPGIQNPKPFNIMTHLLVQILPYILILFLIAQVTSLLQMQPLPTTAATSVS